MAPNGPPTCRTAALVQRLKSITKLVVQSFQVTIGARRTTIAVALTIHARRHSPVRATTTCTTQTRVQ